LDGPVRDDQTKLKISNAKAYKEGEDKEDKRGLVYLRFMIFGIFALLLLVPFINAEDNSKWCGTITAIYGVCSPELISNFLAKSSYSIPRVVPPKPPATTIVLSKPSPTIVEQVKPEGAKPLIRPCFYYTSEGWKFCKFVG
jgi:hypothetical protein